MTRPAPNGFTLVEVLISLALFIVISAISVSVFVQTNTENRRQRAEAGAEADAMTILETIGQDVRSGQIDYEQYRINGIDLTTSQPLSGIILRNYDNEQMIYRLAADQVQVCVGTPGDCTDFQTIHSDASDVTQFEVYLSPAADPFFAPVSDADCPVGGNFEGDDPGESGVGLCKDTACWPGQIARGGYCHNPDAQPVVTMVLKTLRKEGTVESTFHVQTTMTTRQYER